MIFTRYITKNILTSFVVTSLVLVVILSTNLAVRLLTDIHEDGIYGGYLIPLIFFNLLDDIPLLLPLCFLIGVFLALSRLHRNQEMIAMQALGVSFKQLLQSILLISIPVCIVTASISLYLSPISMALNNQYRSEFDLANQLKSLIARSFASSLDSQHVIYVDENDQLLVNQTNETNETNEINNSADHQWPMRGVFIYSDLSDTNQERVIVSEKAKQILKAPTSSNPSNGIESQYLVLSNGEIYTFESNQLVELLNFERYEIALNQNNSSQAAYWSLKTIPSIDLYNSNNQRHNAEFYWRLSAPINLLVAGILALLLTNFKPRDHSFKKLFLGILIYIGYYNFLSSARYWAEDSSLSAGFLFSSIHLVMITFILIALLVQKGYLKSWLSDKK